MSLVHCLSIHGGAMPRRYAGFWPVERRVPETGTRWRRKWIRIAGVDLWILSRQHRIIDSRRTAQTLSFGSAFRMRFSIAGLD
jgi:hypothetical protein